MDSCLEDEEENNTFLVASVTVIVDTVSKAFALSLLRVIAIA
jgi:hypothetical protein